MFCIEPGAGIGGIGNGFKVAPVQYPFTAFPNSLSIGESICYKNNSIALGKDSSTSNENSIAFFGNTLGKNSLSFYANDVYENCVRFGNKENNKYNLESINLKAKEIVLDCDELILNDNNFKNNKILELEEKINNLYKEVNYLKK